MQDRLLALGRAKQPAGAAVVDLASPAQHRAATSRARTRHLKVRDIAGPLATRADHPPHHLRDHIAGAANNHLVTHPHPLAAQLKEVVQRGVAHRRAAHEDRRELGHWRELAGAPDLDFDAFELGDLLLRRILVRHRPARLAGDKAQALLLQHRVELVDHAIDVEGQRVALGAHRAVKTHQPGSALADRPVSAYRQAHGEQGVERRTVCGGLVPTPHLA